MSKVKVTLNRKAVSTELLKSDDIKSLMQDIANDIVGGLAGDYEIETYDGKNRSNVSIRCADEETYKLNLQTNELLYALGGAK